MFYPHSKLVTVSKNSSTIHIANTDSQALAHCGRTFVGLVRNEVNPDDVCQQCKGMLHPDVFKSHPFKQLENKA